MFLVCSKTSHAPNVMSEPSRQRTPVLYQAGSSSRGREFAATHAECVFVFGADKRITRDLVADIRSRATAHGRDPKDILVFYNRAVVAGRTRREAEEKYREYREYASIEGALAWISHTGWGFERQTRPLHADIVGMAGCNLGESC